MDKNARRHACVTLLLIALFSLVFVFSPVQKAMATIAISSISPNSGYVYDTITVDGTINTTGGSFTVRWNGTAIVATGQAVGVNVNTSFEVPPTVGNRSVTVELIDDAFPELASPPMNFTLLTRFSLNAAVPTAPRQLQEGSTVPIAVNVTGGEGNTVYTANITVRNPANQNTSILAPLSNTTTIGHGDTTKIYPTDFAGAHLNYTGKYVVTSNVTNIPQEFTVGLTDRLEYRRNQTVQIQAAGYSSSEVVTVNIKSGLSSVGDFPINATASSGGVVVLSWKIPSNSTPGTYSLSITSSTFGGTVKTPPDVQNFDVLGFVCRIVAINRGGEGVADVLVEVYNASSSGVLLMGGNTTSSGSIVFNLNSGTYTFKAFYNDVEVGLLNQTVTMDTDFDLPLNLVDFVATVETEAGEGVQSIGIALKYNYTTRTNNTLSATASMQTNQVGFARIHNLFTNTTYLVEATRFDMPFNATTLHIEIAPSSPVSLQFTLPTFTLNLHASDSQNKPAVEVQIRIFEWTAGVTTPIQSSQTNGNGNASFSLLFGRYRVRAFKGDALLNETIINLIENPTTLALNLITVNVKVNVFVSDYFGQPIANAEVKIEREIDQENVLAGSQFTGGDGSALFTLSLGGDSRISVFVSGRLVAVNTQFLGGGSNQVMFRIGDYVAVLGYPIETGAFTSVSFIIVLVVIFIVAMRRRFIQIFRRTRKG